MEQNGYEKFAKWQNITREQLGATSNLIIGLSTGLLGFVTILLLEHKLVSCSYGFGVATLPFLFVSISVGLYCAINRVSDFRITSKISNPNYTNDAQKEEWRDISRKLGELTWRLFRVQIWCFALGGGAISISVMMQLFH